MIVASSTRNPMGRRFTGTFRRATLRGLGDLNAPATAAQADALNAGATMDQINQMAALGATDLDFESVASGAISADGWIAIITNPNSAAAAAAIASAGGASSGTGDPTTDDAAASDPAHWYDLAGQLRQANQEIQSLESAVLADPNFARAHGSDVIALRNEYSGTAAQFIQAYGSLFGSSNIPPGLSGLGVAPVLIIVGAAVLFAAVAAAIYAIHAHILSVQQAHQETMVQLGIKQQQQNTAQQLRAQAGNPALSDAARKQLLDQAVALERSAGAPPGVVQAGAADSFTAFFSANWKLLLGGFALITILPSVMQTVSPKRR
jgi:hypothetical protein